MSKQPVQKVQPVQSRVNVPAPWDYRSHFDGELATWQPPLTSIDNDIAPGFAVNRGRSRELALTNPFASNATQIIKDSVVGRSFRLVLAPEETYLGVSMDEADEWASEAEKLWQLYAEGITFDADATRKSTWTFLMHQAQEGLHVDGEILGIVRAKDGPFGFVTCLQMLEPERLDDLNAQGAVQRNGKNESRYGIVRDEFGEPIAYDIRSAHLGDARWAAPGATYDVKRIDRYLPSGRPQVLHTFDDFRPSMTRGVSREMLSSLKQMKMLSVFGDAQLSRSIMSASWAAVIESELDYEDAMGILGANGGNKYENNFVAASAGYLQGVAPYYNSLGLRYNGARVAHLMPGDALKLVQSQVEGAQFDLFEKAFLRQLAAGLNVSYEELSRDFSNVSYAAARMSMASMFRRYERMRAMLSTKFAMPFVSCFLEEAILTKRLPMLGSKFKATEAGFKLARHGLCVGTFISWGKPSIDPVKETTGDHMQMALGITTLRDVAAENGQDYATLLRQRAREVKLRASMEGLNPGGVDPTLVVGSGPKDGNPEEGRAAKSNGPG